MARALPPFGAIRAFEAAARHQSFTRAAEELGMTQAAISYQIKLLEERVGATLFIREPKQVRLSPAGRQIEPSISQSFAAIRATFNDLDNSLHNNLTIAAPTTFAAAWLIPRLGSLQMARPDLTARLEVSTKEVDLAAGTFDVAIRSGFGDWDGMDAQFLFPANLSVVCSPALLKKAGVKTPADLLRVPLLGVPELWSSWFSAAGIANARYTAATGNLGAQHLECLAAIAGQGAAIVTPEFFKSEIALGKIAQPFDILAEKDRGYWVICPTGMRNAPKIKLFRQWIMEQAAADGPAV